MLLSVSTTVNKIICNDGQCCGAGAAQKSGGSATLMMGYKCRPEATGCLDVPEVCPNIIGIVATLDGDHWPAGTHFTSENIVNQILEEKKHCAGSILCLLFSGNGKQRWAGSITSTNP